MNCETDAVSEKCENSWRPHIWRESTEVGAKVEATVEGTQVRGRTQASQEQDGWGGVLMSRQKMHNRAYNVRCLENESRVKAGKMGRSCCSVQSEWSRKASVSGQH